MRFGYGTLALLGICAALAAAALAHVAIDIVGDYALPHDTYDFIAHNSRDLVTALALAVAGIAALRGLRSCCEHAAANRGRLPVPAISRFQGGAFSLAVIATTAVLVPAMEMLDGRLDGVPVAELDDAFGGSISLGLGTTILCAAIVALVVLAFARWIVSHRDSIATMIGSLVLVREQAKPAASALLFRHVARPQKRRVAPALRRCKRGPPNVALGLPQRFILHFRGEPREYTTLARLAWACCLRDRAFIWGARDSGGTFGIAR